MVSAILSATLIFIIALDQIFRSYSPQYLRKPLSGVYNQQNFANERPIFTMDHSDHSGHLPIQAKMGEADTNATQQTNLERFKPGTETSVNSASHNRRSQQQEMQEVPHEVQTDAIMEELAACDHSLPMVSTLAKDLDTQKQFMIDIGKHVKEFGTTAAKAIADINMQRLKQDPRLETKISDKLVRICFDPKQFRPQTLEIGKGLITVNGEDLTQGHPQEQSKCILAFRKLDDRTQRQVKNGEYVGRMLTHDLYHSRGKMMEITFRVVRHFSQQWAGWRGPALEFFVGEGHLAIAIAKAGCSTVIGVDVCQKSLTKAEQNLREFTSNKTKFILYQSDIFSEFTLPELQRKVKLAVTNPPVLHSEADTVVFGVLWTGLQVQVRGILLAWIPGGRVQLTTRIMKAAGFSQMGLPIWYNRGEARECRVPANPAVYDNRFINMVPCLFQRDEEFAVKHLVAIAATMMKINQEYETAKCKSFLRPFSASLDQRSYRKQKTNYGKFTAENFHRIFLKTEEFFATKNESSFNLEPPRFHENYIKSIIERVNSQVVAHVRLNDRRPLQDTIGKIGVGFGEVPLNNELQAIGQLKEIFHRVVPERFNKGGPFASYYQLHNVANANQIFEWIEMGKPFHLEKDEVRKVWVGKQAIPNQIQEEKVEISNCKKDEFWQHRVNLAEEENLIGDKTIRHLLSLEKLENKPPKKQEKVKTILREELEFGWYMEAESKGIDAGHYIQQKRLEWDEANRDRVQLCQQELDMLEQIENDCDDNPNYRDSIDLLRQDEELLEVVSSDSDDSDDSGDSSLRGEGARAREQASELQSVAGANRGQNQQEQQAVQAQSNPPNISMINTGGPAAEESKNQQPQRNQQAESLFVPRMQSDNEELEEMQSAIGSVFGGGQAAKPRLERVKKGPQKGEYRLQQRPLQPGFLDIGLTCAGCQASEIKLKESKKEAELKNNRIANLEKSNSEKETLIKNLQSNRKFIDAYGQMEEMSTFSLAKYKELEKENGNFKTVHLEEQKKCADLQEQLDKLKDVLKKKEELLQKKDAPQIKLQLEKAKKEAQDALSGQQTLMDKLVQTEKKLEEALKRIKELEDLVTKHKEQEDECLELKAKLQQRVKTLETSNRVCNQKNGALQKSIDKVKKKHDEQHHELEDLKQSHALVRSKKLSLENEVKDLKQQNIRLLNVQEENAILRGQANAHNDELSSLRSQVFQASLDQAAQQLERKLSEANELNQRLREQVSETEKFSLTYKQSRDYWMNKFEVLEREAYQNQTALKTRLTKQETLCQRLELDLMEERESSIRQWSMVSQLVQKIQTVHDGGMSTDLIHEHQAKEVTISRAQMSLTKVVEKIHVLEMTNSSLSNQVKTLEIEVTKMAERTTLEQSTMLKNERRVVILEREVQSYKIQLQETICLQTGQSKNIESLTKENTTFQFKVENYERTISELRSEVQKALSRDEIPMNQEHVTRNTHLKAEVQELQSQIVILKSENENYQCLKTQLENRISYLDGVILNLRGEVGKLEESFQESQQELQASRESVAHYVGIIEARQDNQLREQFSQLINQQLQEASIREERLRDELICSNKALQITMRDLRIQGEALIQQKAINEVMQLEATQHTERLEWNIQFREIQVSEASEYSQKLMGILNQTLAQTQEFHMSISRALIKKRAPQAVQTEIMNELKAQVRGVIEAVKENAQSLMRPGSINPLIPLQFNDSLLDQGMKALSDQRDLVNQETFWPEKAPEPSNEVWMLPIPARPLVSPIIPAKHQPDTEMTDESKLEKRKDERWQKHYESLLGPGPILPRPDAPRPRTAKPNGGELAMIAEEPEEEVKHEDNAGAYQHLPASSVQRTQLRSSDKWEAIPSSDDTFGKSPDPLDKLGESTPAKKLITRTPLVSYMRPEVRKEMESNCERALQRDMYYDRLKKSSEGTSEDATEPTRNRLSMANKAGIAPSEGTHERAKQIVQDLHDNIPTQSHLINELMATSEQRKLFNEENQGSSEGTYVDPYGSVADAPASNQESSHDLTWASHSDAANLAASSEPMNRAASTQQ